MQNFLISFFLYFAGPIALLSAIVWGRAVWVAVPRPDWRRDWPMWLAAAAATAVFFFSVRVDLKVLSDETNLLSVANMLTYFGKASNTEMGTHYYHLFYALDLAVPTRPVLFPVLVSLVQHVVGVKPWAPFVVNAISCWALFTLALTWARARLGEGLRPGVMTGLALLMSPVLAIVSTSAGYDLVSLTVGFGVFLLLMRYNETRDAPTLNALLLGMVCYASVRYESLAAFPLLGAGLVFFEGKGWIRKVQPLTVALIALFLAPLVVQRFLTWGAFENPPGVPAFSFRHLMDHLPPFWYSFFVDGQGPYPILLHWLGLAGIFFALRAARDYAWVVAAYLLFLLLLLLCHHFGFAGHPTQARLFLPLSFLLSFTALYALKRLEAWADPRAMLPLFAILFVYHHQYAVHDPFSTQLTMTREMRHIREFLRADEKVGDVFIYDRPGQLTAIGQSAVSPEFFKNHQGDLLMNLRNRLYQRFIMIERVPYNDTEGKFGLERPGFSLRVLVEHQLSPEEKLRLAEVLP